MTTENLYDDKKFLDLLFTVSRSMVDHRPTLDEMKPMLERALDEAHRFMGTKGEVQVLELLIDRLKQGDSYMQISQLAHMFWFYFQNIDAAAKGYIATAYPDPKTSKHN